MLPGRIPALPGRSPGKHHPLCSSFLGTPKPRLPTHLQNFQESHWLQDPLVVVAQGCFRDTRLGHDVAQHALHDTLADRLVQAAIHDAPGAPNKADSATGSVDGGVGEGTQ